MSHQEDITVDRLEDFILVPEDGESPPISIDFKPNGLSLAGFMVSGRHDESVAILTTQRHVGSLDVVAQCLVLNSSRDVVTKDGFPASLRLRFSIPRGKTGGLAAAFMTTTTVFQSGEAVPIEGFAVLVEPHAYVDGVAVLSEDAKMGDLGALMSPMDWDEEHVALLSGLIEYPGFVKSLNENAARAVAKEEKQDKGG